MSYSSKDKGFLSDYEREVFHSIVQDREPPKPVAGPRAPIEHATKHQPPFLKHHNVINSKQERRPHTVVDGRPKKGGSGGKGTWGNPLDPCDDLEDADPDDPLYDEIEMAYEDAPESAPVAKSLQSHKEKILSIVRQYFVSGNVSSTSADVKETSPNHRYYFVKKLISTAMDKHDKDKEMAACLLSSLYNDAVPADQMWKGYFNLLEGLDDLEIDCPDAVKVAALFLARAVVDDILPPVFLQRARDSLGETSLAASTALKLATGHLSAPDHSDWLEQVWGGSSNSTVKGRKAQVSQILRDLLASGDVPEACLSIRELNLPFFHHEVVKQAVTLALQEAEASGGRARLLALLRECSEEALVTTSQMAKGLAQIADRLDDLALDIPAARAEFAGILRAGAQQGWVDAAAAEQVSGGARSGGEAAPESSQTICAYKQRSAGIILEYFESSDCGEVARSLEELAFPDLAHLFIKKLFTAAMDRRLREKEMACTLLSALFPDALPLDQVEAAFLNLLESVEDLALDIPAAARELSLFLARAVVDDVLPPLYLPRIQAHLQSKRGLSLALEVVRNAEGLLAARHAGERILRAFGGTGGRTAAEVKLKVRQLLEEYVAGGDLPEACRCIRDLNVPFYHHEVVKRALVLSLEREEERLLGLLKECAQENLVSADQMRQGVKRVQEDIADLSLDVPDAGPRFQLTVERGQAEGWIPRA